MEDVKLLLNEEGHGHFIIREGEKKLADMVIAVRGNDLTVYHTEVEPEAEGKGLAKKMFGTMVTYARENNLKVIPLCPFVHAQFKRHPDEYKDIWKHEPKM